MLMITRKPLKNLLPGLDNPLTGDAAQEQVDAQACLYAAARTFSLRFEETPTEARISLDRRQNPTQAPAASEDAYAHATYVLVEAVRAHERATQKLAQLAVEA